MNGWVYVGIVVSIILGLKYIPSFIRRQRRKICGQSKVGHNWQGCKCKKCGEERHEWEHIQTGEIGTWKGGGDGMLRRFPKGSGAIPAHIHKCKKCGKEMRNVIKR